MKIGTGISTQLPSNMAALIFPRSGLSTKKGLRLANCVGLVDPDYRGEYIVALYNDSNTPQIVMPGERIAQVVFSPFYRFREVLYVFIISYILLKCYCFSKAIALSIHPLPTS